MGQVSNTFWSAGWLCLSPWENVAVQHVHAMKHMDMLVVVYNFTVQVQKTSQFITVNVRLLTSSFLLTSVRICGEPLRIVANTKNQLAGKRKRLLL